MASVKQNLKTCVKGICVTATLTENEPIAAETAFTSCHNDYIETDDGHKCCTQTVDLHGSIFVNVIRLQINTTIEC